MAMLKMCFEDKDWQSAVFDNLSWVFVLVGLVLAALPMASTFFDPPFELGWYYAAHLNNNNYKITTLWLKEYGATIWRRHKRTSWRLPTSASI